MRLRRLQPAQSSRDANFPTRAIFATPVSQESPLPKNVRIPQRELIGKMLDASF